MGYTKNACLQKMWLVAVFWTISSFCSAWTTEPDLNAALRSYTFKRTYPLLRDLELRNEFLKKIRSFKSSPPIKRHHSMKSAVLSPLNKVASNEKNFHESAVETTEKAKLRYRVALDNEGKLELQWDIRPIEERIDFRLTAAIRSTDMLGFGFSDYGEPQQADFIMFWTDRKGHHMFQDCHTDADGLLHLDAHQDYVLDDVEVMAQNQLTLTFHRKYDTCDDEDYMIDEGTTHMLFFTRDGPQEAAEDLNMTEVKLGLQRSQLLKSQLADPTLPEDTFTFTANVKNVTIPAQETTYWCHVTKLPRLSQRYHIVKYDGVISDNGLVHHLEVFHCEVPNDVEIRDFNEPCITMETRPPGLESCRKVIGAWAMGATGCLVVKLVGVRTNDGNRGNNDWWQGSAPQGVTYPEEAGSPVGGPGYSRYVMLEVHYNNPSRLKGLKDSSGIRFYATRSLRRYDVGIMELGQEYTDKPALPPGMPRWKLQGYCIEDCTQVGLEENGIKVFASQLHTHQTGKTVYTKHYRNGVELPELNRDQHYSPHYQEIRKLHRQVHVMPGDVLITTCEDSTINKTNVTLVTVGSSSKGGFAISDEMCVNYIHYYPKQNLEVCKSSVTTKSLYDFFSFLHKYQGENTSSSKGVNENYHSIRWTPMNIELTKTYFEMAPLSMQCNQSDGNRFPGTWEGKPVPTVLYPLPPQERPCLV